MTEPAPEHDWLTRCLAGLGRGRIAVLGDFCLDGYWFIDADESERSVETGLPVRRVREQRYSLGGAGNVLANLAALGVGRPSPGPHSAGQSTGRLWAVGIVGDDLFGAAVRRLLTELDVDCAGLLARPDWQTPVYAKPHKISPPQLTTDHWPLTTDSLGEEESRIDFGSFNRMDGPGVAAVMGQLDRIVADRRGCDVVIVNQQLPGGVITGELIEQLNRVAAGGRTRFIADSRHRAELFRGMTLKLNAQEAARVLAVGTPASRAGCPLLGPGGTGGQAGQPASGTPQSGTSAAVLDLAARLNRRTGQPVLVTCGAGGIVAADESGVHAAPAASVAGPIDAVGAGDTVLAAVAAVLAGGGDAITAARLANLAAAVTVRKLHTTGTATPEEIIAAAIATDQHR